MHIAIDARMYHIKGGHGRYLRELIDNLQDIDKTNRYTLLMHSEGLSLFKQKNPNFTPLLEQTHWYTLKEQTRLLQTLNNLDADLVHFPHWNIPFFYRKPFVVTIHDLILLEHPTSAASTKNKVLYWIKYVGFRIILLSIKRAQHIITVSNAAKDQIEKHFPYLSSPISVIPLAAAPKNISSNQLPATNPYFLYVGTAFPHKNLTFLLHAFHQFTIRYGNHKLMLAGPKSKFYDRLLKTETAKTMLDAGTLQFVESPSDEHLAELYKNATASVYPSLIEGFGLPPLEAALHGTPSICSDAPAFEEVVGNGARYAASDSLESWITQFRSISTNRDTRYFLGQRAKQRTTRFSWTQTAKSTQELFSSLTKEHNFA